MDESILNEIAAEVANGECVLFTGAGVSMQGGGPGWTELLSNTAERFGYESPMIDAVGSDGSTKYDYFDIFSDIVDKNDTRDVHKYVTEQLSGIELEEPVSELAGLPWFASFTTNYDVSFEKELRERQQRNVQKVLTDSDYPMGGLQANLIHVQLMGTIERSPSDSGSMVLTGDEKQMALDSRSGIFNLLETHAANLSFVFLGYSFNDDIFTDVLRGITANIGTPENTYYALFREPLDPSDEAFLKSQNVIPIIGELDEFADKLVNKTRARDTDDARNDAIPVGSEVFELSRKSTGDFISNHDPVLIDRYDSEVSIKEFFKGNTDSLYPFDQGWHFSRKEEDKIMGLLIESDVDTISVRGSPGSGRSFLINAIVNRLIKNQNSFAVEIHNTDLSPIPDERVFKQFLEEIKHRAHKLDAESPNSVVFYSKSRLDKNDLLSLETFDDKIDLNVICIYEADERSSNPKLDSRNHQSVKLDDYVTSKIKDEFIDYLVDITNEQKLEPRSKQEIEDNLYQDNRFLPVMYKTVYPARQSIENIIDIEYSNISSEVCQKLVRLCAVGSHIGVEVPISVCKRYLSATSPDTFSYKDVFDIVNSDENSLIRMREDVQTIHHLSIYHPIIANYLCNDLETDEVDAILEDISESVNLKSRHEAGFIDELLISNGVNRDDWRDVHYSRDGIQKALEVLKNRQPARPIVHHLGRFIAKRGGTPDEFIPILKEALNEPKETYAQQENKENIYSSIADRLWKYKKPRLRTESADHHEIKEIFNYIKKARAIESNLYSYTIQSRILYQMAEKQEGEDQLSTIRQAAEIIEEGLSQEGDYEWKKRLRQRKVDLWALIDEEEAEEIAEEQLRKHDLGDGYYTLAALYYYKKQKPNQALNKLDSVYEASEYPAQAPYLRLRILLEEQYGDYEKMLGLVKELESNEEFEDRWRSHLIKAVIYFINEEGSKAKEHFTDSWTSAPREERYGAEYFWNEGGSHKKFYGLIGSDLTSSEGHIYNHGFDHWDDDLYFNPREQELESELRPGMRVQFELGFSPRGPKGWDLKIRDS